MAVALLVLAGCSGDPTPPPANMSPLALASACPTGTTTAKRLQNLDCRVRLLERQTPSPAPSTTGTPTPTTATPTPTPTPPAGGFPTRTSVGVPAGWTPAQTVSGNLTAATAGQVIQDVRVVGSIIVKAPNVTVRRVEVVGGGVNTSGCPNGLVIEDTSFTGTPTNIEPAVQFGGYTARRVLIDGHHEGFRVSSMESGCGPVLIEDSYARIVSPPDCSAWHGDGLQGYHGNDLTIRNTVLIMPSGQACSGTAPFFFPNDNYDSTATVEGLVVSGSGFSFRLNTPGTVRDMHVIEGGYHYGPTSVTCSLVTSWQASVSRFDSNGQPVVVRPLSCA